jgi:predicted 2-oxoglutarate/Fe(II)-dependent dioxygenase YbiX
MLNPYNYEQVSTTGINPWENLHHLIWNFENFLDAEVCRFIINFAKSCKYQDLGVFDADKTNRNQNLKTEWKTDISVRNTQTVDLSPIGDLINAIMKDAVFGHINPKLQQFGVRILDAEGVQLLRYGPGGHYLPHIDGESIFNNHGSLEWRKSVDRDVSLVIYLSDPSEYGGGEIQFPWFNMHFKPSQGTLLVFPSTHEFVHGVIPLTQGERFALVTWMRITTVNS